MEHLGEFHKSTDRGEFSNIFKKEKDIYDFKFQQLLLRFLII
jgi:hypothetical protein